MNHEDLQREMDRLCAEHLANEKAAAEAAQHRTSVVVLTPKTAERIMQPRERAAA